MRRRASFFIIGGTCLGLASLVGCGGSAPEPLPEPAPETTLWAIEQSIDADGQVRGVRIVKLPELEVVGLCGEDVGEWTLYEADVGTSVSYEAPRCQIEVSAEEVRVMVP